MQYVAFDAHKHYTWARVERPEGTVVGEQRIAHERGALRRFLAGCEPGSPVAIETVGNWYWMVDETEAAGYRPQLVHAHKAKLMLGVVNKTDRLDARGMNQLQRTGTLPTVWIPPGELRDWRDLPRTRMVLVRQRTQLKNRIHATLAKYALTVGEVDDLFGKQGRTLLRQRLAELPPQTAFATTRVLDQIETLNHQVDLFERQMANSLRSPTRSSC
ncbi:MAG: transposase [Armatimonadota bacterium]|nr:transposase [Armatimonadota bacterium]